MSIAVNVRTSGLSLLCLIHSRYIIMIVVIAVMIAVTGTVMATDILATNSNEDKPVGINKFLMIKVVLTISSLFC